MTATSSFPAAATAPELPRLIVSDLDGTFLSSTGSVSVENSTAVRRAQEAGIPVIFATGRPARWLDVIADLPGAHPIVIVSNGAALYDLGSREMLDGTTIAPEVALESITAIRVAVPDAVCALESGLRFGYEPAYQSWTDGDIPEDEALFSGTIEEILAADSYLKLLVRSESLGADELLSLVAEVVADRLAVTHSQASGLGLVEVSAPGVSKAAMLKRYCARLNIPAEQVAAFGDMPNDREMLGWVGRPHVVANAHPDLLAQGFPIVGSNDESGVGRTISAWLDG